MNYIMSDEELPHPEELVEGTVKEVKSHLKDAENPDYHQILKAEKHNKDRVTLERFLEKHVNSQDESDSSEPKETD